MGWLTTDKDVAPAPLATGNSSGSPEQLHCDNASADLSS